MIFFKNKVCAAILCILNISVLSAKTYRYPGQISKVVPKKIVLPKEQKKSATIVNNAGGTLTVTRSCVLKGDEKEIVKLTPGKSTYNLREQELPSEVKVECKSFEYIFELTPPGKNASKVSTRVVLAPGLITVSKKSSRKNESTYILKNGNNEIVSFESEVEA